MTALKEANKDDKIWILFVDFAKAYDMVDHELLFEKMKKYNISE